MSSFLNKVNMLNDEIPSNIEAEEAVVCSILHDNSLYFSEIVKPDLFFNPDLRRIWQCIISLMNKNEVVNTSTILDQFDQRNVNSKGIKNVLQKLNSKIILPNGYSSVVKVLEDVYLRRQLHISANKIKDIAHSAKDPLTAAADATNLINSIKIDKEVDDCAQGIDEEFQEMLRSMAAGEQGKYVSTGFSNIDDLFKGGIRENDYIVIGANSSGGKSMFGFQLAWNLARQGLTGLVFSAEMSKAMVNMRSRAFLGQISMSKLMRNDSTTDRVRLAKAHAIMKETLGVNLHIDYTQNVSVQSIRAKAVQHKSKHGKLDFILLDYLQFATFDGGARTRVEEVQNITKELKKISRDLNTPVIALSQLNMEAAKDGEPKLQHLAECPSQIWRDADIVALMHEENVFDFQTSRIKFNVAKGRNIGVGFTHFKLYKDKMTFVVDGQAHQTFEVKDNTKYKDAKSIVDEILGEEEDGPIPF